MSPTHGTQVAQLLRAHSRIVLKQSTETQSALACLVTLLLSAESINRYPISRIHTGLEVDLEKEHVGRFRNCIAYSGRLLADVREHDHCCKAVEGSALGAAEPGSERIDCGVRIAGTCQQGSFVLRRRVCNLTTRKNCHNLAHNALSHAIACS